MNWEAIGAVAELAGVIVSLIYLAKQISATSDNVNQNTIALLNQSEASSLSGVLEIYKPQIADPSVAELMLHGYSDIDSLSPVDRHRFATMLLAIFESHQTFFLQNARGATGPETWDYYSRVFDSLMKVPGVASWWTKGQRNFDPNFIRYVNDKVGES